MSGLAAIDILDAARELVTCGVYRRAELAQRRLEYGVVVGMDRYGSPRLDDLECADSLRRVHREQDPGDAGTAKVDQAEVDIGIDGGSGV
jgi:hypothetical protein